MDSTDNYTLSIPKAAVSTLPTVKFPGKITVVETMSLARKAIAYLNDQLLVGFDTETRPAFRKGHLNDVALMQIATDSHSFLFRLNRLGLFDELKEFLENPGISKIGLSLKDDFHMLHRHAEFTPKGFIELQELVRRYHIADASLQRIYAIIFNERISKSQRLSNWETDFLSEAQQMYASIDAWACLKIYNYLLSGDFHPELSPYRITPEAIDSTTDN